MINVEDTVRGALGEADIKLITTIASALSVALENATLIEGISDAATGAE